MALSGDAPSMWLEQSPGHPRLQFHARNLRLGTFQGFALPLPKARLWVPITQNRVKGASLGLAFGIYSVWPLGCRKLEPEVSESEQLTPGARCRGPNLGMAAAWASVALESSHKFPVLYQHRWAPLFLIHQPHVALTGSARFQFKA